jgi:phage FluMu protein gp41
MNDVSFMRGGDADGFSLRSEDGLKIGEENVFEVGACEFTVLQSISLQTKNLIVHLVSQG